MRDDLAAAERLLAVVAGLRLDADTPGSPATARLRGQRRAARAGRRRRGRRAGRSSAPTSSNSSLRRRALPGDHVGVVVRRDQRQAALGGEPPADRLAVLACSGRRRRPRRRSPRVAATFDGRRVVRHDDRRRHAEQLRRKRDRLRVVARRERDHAAPPRLVRELRERVVGAAELERAHALQVLALEEQRCAGPRVRRARGQDRRAVGDARQPLRGGGDVVVGREARSARLRFGRRHRQRFWKSGFRFSTKAAMPSFWSAVANMAWNTRRSKRMPSASVVS